MDSADARSPLPLRIHWEGAHFCRPDADLAEHLRRLLGPERERRIDTLEVRIAITRVPAGLDLAIHAESPGGEIHRTLEVANCAELAEAAALVLSVWIAELTVPATPQTPREDDTLPTPTVHAPTSHRPTDGAAPVVARSPRISKVWFRAPRWRERLRAEVGGVLAFGILPEQSQGATAGLTTELIGFQGSLRCLWLQELTHLSQRSPRLLGGRYGLVAAELRLTRGFPITTELQLETFAWSMLGRLRAEGVGADEIAVSSGDFGASGFGMATVVRRGRLHLGVEGSAGLPWGRPRYLVDENVVFRPPPLLGLLGIRVGFGFL